MKSITIPTDAIKVSSISYYVDRDGNTYCEKKVINKPTITENLSHIIAPQGYHYIGINEFGTPTKRGVHRLVAEAYLPNPESKCDVNHKDFNKSNNNVDNLEWATRSENIQHSYDHNPSRRTSEGVYKHQPVNQLTKEGILIKTFDSVSDAANAVESTYRDIWRVCTGKRKSTRGFKWEYA